jgi:heme-degrading monooxygenase HmoA
MFARIVDFVSSPGKTRILNETIQRKLLPILRVQPGFVDEIVLESDVEPDRVLTLSIWKTREQAELYSREKYPALKEVLLASLETDPVVRTFNVASSTTRNIPAGRAA